MRRPLIRLPVLLAAASVLVMDTAQADSFYVTAAPAGQQTGAGQTTCGAGAACATGTETFDGIATGSALTVTSQYGTNGLITGTYSGVTVTNADMWGGAGGSGHYADISNGGSYSLALSTTLASGLDYFGFDLTALDAGNTLSFYKNSTLLGTFNAAYVLSVLGNCPNPYCGNPNAAYAGQDTAQPYAFLNILDTNGTFNRIVFSETIQNAGFESDNHTVGYVTGLAGTPVPEPGTLAILASGLGLAGLLAWRRRTRRPARASRRPGRG